MLSIFPSTFPVYPYRFRSGNRSDSVLARHYIVLQLMLKKHNFASLLHKLLQNTPTSRKLVHVEGIVPQLDIRRWPILKNCFCPTKLVIAFIFSFAMLFYRTSCRHAELHLHGCLHRRVSPHAVWAGATEILQLPIQHLGLCGEWMLVRLAGQPNFDTNRPNCVDDQTKPCQIEGIVSNFAT